MFCEQLSDTPLHRAASEGYIEIVDQLLKAGADPNARNYEKETPLHKAIRTDGEKMVKMLISAKANVNAQDAVSLSIFRFISVDAYLLNFQIFDYYTQWGVVQSSTNYV